MIPQTSPGFGVGQRWELSMAERLGITDLASAQRSLKTDGLGAPRAGAVISGANLALGAEFFNTLGPVDTYRIHRVMAARVTTA